MPQVKPAPDCTATVRWLWEDKRYMIIVEGNGGTHRKWCYAGEQLRGAPQIPLVDAILRVLQAEIDSWLC